jgi:hypothetical protein
LTNNRLTSLGYLDDDVVAAFAGKQKLLGHDKSRRYKSSLLGSQRQIQLLVVDQYVGIIAMVLC